MGSTTSLPTEGAVYFRSYDSSAPKLLVFAQPGGGCHGNPRAPYVRVVCCDSIVVDRGLSTAADLKEDLCDSVPLHADLAHVRKWSRGAVCSRDVVRDADLAQKIIGAVRAQAPAPSLHTPSMQCGWSAASIVLKRVRTHTPPLAQSDSAAKD